MHALLRPVQVMTPLSAAVIAYTWLPAGLERDLGYQLIGLVAVVVAFGGLLRQGAQRHRGWFLVLAGYAGWVLGDLCYTVSADVLGIEAYPGPADLVYGLSYGLIMGGLLMMVRRRGVRVDVAALLDATIVAIGVAVVAGVFVIVPIARDSDLSVAAKLTSSAYPIADVLLLGTLVRLWWTYGSRTAAFRLLIGSLSLTLAGDALYNVSTIVASSTASTAVNDAMFLGGYVLVAGAAWSPSASELTEPVPGHGEVADPTRRLVVLTGGLLLPPLALLADGLTSTGVAWPLIVVGSITLSVLVVVRMAGLLGVVRVQAVQLAALARSDPLTGIPNRRTWDHELSRACQTAREDAAPLTVALLDLDHFKAYNDSFGHPAGDVLLREATAAWSELLEPGQVLARVGGEEFALLLPGMWAADARVTVQRLQRVTPSGQTFSAGVATWDHTSSPSAVVAAADQAMYDAKRGGRDRVHVAEQRSRRGIPAPSVVVQPIVDLQSAIPVGVEALSRFASGEPATIFEQHARNGTGPRLEALAIAGALARRPVGLWMSINVSLNALGTEPVRDALSGDLHGIVLEITEHAETDAETSAMGEPAQRMLDDCRSRGALVAIDDWGSGFSNLDRVLRMRPEIVKMDMSLVQDLDSDYHRAVIGSIITWADQVGAQVCAEGIETEQQWRALRRLGVHLGQGHLFGLPSPFPPALGVPSIAARPGLVVQPG